MKTRKIIANKDGGNQWWTAKILVASGTGYEEIGQRSIVAHFCKIQHIAMGMTLNLSLNISFQSKKTIGNIPFNQFVSVYQ